MRRGNYGECKTDGDRYRAAVPDARQADAATRPDGGDRLGDDLPDTGTLHDDVGLKSHLRNTAGVVCHAKSAPVGSSFTQDLNLPHLPGHRPIPRS